MAKDRYRRGQTWTDRDIQGQRGTNRPRQGLTETDMDRLGQTATDWDREGKQEQEGTDRDIQDIQDIQRQRGTSRDRQGQTGTVSACPCLSLLVPACPYLIIVCLWLSLLEGMFGQRPFFNYPVCI